MTLNTFLKSTLSMDVRTDSIPIHDSKKTLKSTVTPNPTCSGRNWSRRVAGRSQTSLIFSLLLIFVLAFLLTVEDNGMGIPQNVDIKQSESLGLRLVVILAEDQLNGQLKLSRGKGTQFQVRFKAT